MNKNTYCIIMAGGIGSRFWPLSRKETPKQFLDILGIGKTLIQQTYDRFTSFCLPENFLIVTGEEYKEHVLKQLPEIKEEQVLTEPFRRNTAPCIAYACSWIRTKKQEANIIVTPADHLILDQKEFENKINIGLKFVDENDSILTLGINPSRPETGYGYIQISQKETKSSDEIVNVKTFTEKPNSELAKVFFESGEFFWNSGIFLWSLKTITKAFKTYLPEMYELFNSVENKINTPEQQSAINSIYSQCDNISIDYGIMEKAQNVNVLTADFGWSDLGTWSSLFDHSSKDKNNNAINTGKVLTYDSQNCIVNLPKNKKAIIEGLDSFIIAENKDCLLICRKDKEQQIRHFTDDLNSEFK